MLRVRPTDALKILHRLCILEGVGTYPNTADELVRIVWAVTKATRSRVEDVPDEMGLLWDRWYESLGRGSPDFGIYNSPLYIAEAFACWAVYSRNYLLGLERPKVLPPSGLAADLDPRRVVDLGCGIGFSTAGLAQLFPKASVTGTNVPGSPQTRIAERLADPDRLGLRPFSIAGSLSSIPGPTDLVFASEYFEHFQKPVLHLREVIETLQPGALLVANTFNSRSIGHFDTYTAGGKTLSGLQTSRAFNAELVREGYEKIQTQFWNNRPAYWRKISL